MKILILTNLFPRVDITTSGIFITNRLKEYPKFNVEYKAVSLTYKDDFLTRFVKNIFHRKYNEPLDEIKEVNYVILNGNIIKKMFLKLGLADLLTQFSLDLEKKINVKQFNLIHAHGMYGDIPAGLVASIIAKKYQKPYIVTLHGSDINYNMSKNKEILLKVLEGASKCIFVSNGLLKKAKSLGYSGKNAVIIPNGYDPEILKPTNKEKIRKELGIYKKEYKYVGFVGNLIPVKRADKLPEIFENISKNYDKVMFLIVGDGYLKEKIEKEMKEKNLEYIFTGRLSQESVAKWMNAMDIMVLPSRNEGFGAVVIEAQACGTCVVGSSNGGIPEAIGFKECIVNEGEHFEERFANKVVVILKNGYKSEELIQRAKEFTWQKIVEKEIKIYKEILTKRGGNGCQ